MTGERAARPTRCLNRLTGVAASKDLWYMAICSLCLQGGGRIFTQRCSKQGALGGLSWRQKHPCVLKLFEAKPSRPHLLSSTCEVKPLWAPCMQAALACRLQKPGRLKPELPCVQSCDSPPAGFCTAVCASQGLRASVTDEVTTERRLRAFIA